MSKSSRTRKKEKRDMEKRSRRNSNRAQYAACLFIGLSRHRGAGPFDGHD